MYPDLKKVGGLAHALNIEFARINSSLKITPDDEDKMPFVYASVTLGNKFSQIYIAAEKRLFMTDFWKDGICLANAQSDSITETVRD